MLYFAVIKKALTSLLNLTPEAALDETKKLFAAKGHDSFKS